MFDLEKAIANWRCQIKAAGVKSADLLAELEAHLREDMKQKTQSGFCTQEAFEYAAANLGNAAALRDEFKKIARAPSGLEKVMLGISGVLVGIILFLSAITIFLSYSSWGERIVASAAVISILVVARGWSYTVRFLPQIENTAWRWIVGLGCIGTGFITSNLFCVIVLPYFGFGAPTANYRQ